MYEQQFNPYAANVAIVKDCFKSGKVLVIGILYIVSLMLSILSLLMQPIDSLFYQSLDLMEKIGIDAPEAYLESAVNSARVSSIVTVFISSVITILTAVAFIIIFAKSRSTNPDSSPVAGVGILHVLAVISFVFAIIGTVIAGVVYVIAVIAALSASTEGVTIASVVVAGILLAIVLFFLIFITASVKNFYRSVKYSLTSVKLQSKGAVAYGVFCIIGAILSGLSLIGTVILVFGSGFAAGSIVSILTSVVTLVQLILTASLALGYNSHIKEHTSGYGSAPYGGSPNTAPPYDTGAQPPYAIPQQDSYQSYSNPLQQNPYNDGFNDGYSEKPPVAPAQKNAFCPNCGAPCDGSASFCSRCGSKL